MPSEPCLWPMPPSGLSDRGSLAIHAIGNGLSLANGLERKHAVKQVDRLLTNTKLNVWS